MIYLNIGRRELGKSTLALWLARKRSQRIIFDPRAQFVTGARRVSSLDEINDAMIAIANHDVDEIIVTPDDQVDLVFEHVNTNIKGLTKADPSRSFAYLLDEARFMDLNSNSFGYLMRCIPRDQADLIITCHAPTDVHPNVRRIADQWMLFQMRHKSDLDAVRERCGAVVAEAVADLKPQEFVQWDDGHQRFYVITNAPAWFVPMKAARPAQGSVPGDPLADLPRQRSPFDKPRLFD